MNTQKTEHRPAGCKALTGKYQALWEETLRVCPELAHLRSFVETAAAREAVDPPGQ